VERSDGILRIARRHLRYSHSDLVKHRAGEILMSLSLQTRPVPLTTDAHGVLRVGETRVSLDTVIFAFKQGSTPEEIVADYSTLDLSDVYAVVTYYLQNQAEVEAYLQRRQAQRDEVRREMETRFPQAGLRERLLARRRTA
jgi:uncharacterized protein (DUF433 family)